MQNRKGFTLVELLVVIAIIGMLVGLLLPAVQQAREAARNMQCKNHLRQLALAALNHEATVRHFPTGGWGAYWIGYPDYGTGKKQPGGYFYSLLPYLEQQALYNYPSYSNNEAEGAKLMCETPLSVAYCPSRRACKVYPQDLVPNPIFGGSSGSEKCSTLTNVGKSDYVINGGSNVHAWAEGPGSYSNSPDISLKAANGKTFSQYHAEANGIGYIASQVTVGEIRDGLSNTVLMGEKYVQADFLETGQDAADNQSCYGGGDADQIRHMGTTYSESATGTDILPPFQDRVGFSQLFAFGSPHSGSFNVSLCDGSVRSLAYQVDLTTYRCLGNRRDGEVFASSPWE